MICPVIKKRINYANDNRDYGRLITKLSTAALAGDLNSQFLLGSAYLKGEIIAQDIEKAIDWHRMAASHGHAEAQACLGKIYWKEIGAPTDYVQALCWLTLSAGNKYDGATRMIDALVALMTFDQVIEGLTLANGFDSAQVASG
jgi:TPR repeat protein